MRSKIVCSLLLLMLLSAFGILCGCGSGAGAVSDVSEPQVAVIRVYYIEAGTDKELADPKQLTDPVNLNVTALTQYQAISGYAYQSASEEIITAQAGETKTLYLYYIKSSESSVPVAITLTVRHLDQSTGQKLLKDEIITSSVRMRVSGKTYAKDISEYTYIKSEPEGELELAPGQNGELTLYYSRSGSGPSTAVSSVRQSSAPASSSAVSSQPSVSTAVSSKAVSTTTSQAARTTVTVRFLPEGGGEDLAAPAVLSGNSDLTVKVSAQIKAISGYTYISASPSTDFTVKAGQTGELILYYTKKNATSFTALYPTSPGTTMINAAKGWVDVSNISQGYITAKYMGDSTKKAKIQVATGSHSYYYDIDNGGRVCTYPLQWGSGTYTFKLFEQKSGAEYYTVLTGSAAVMISNEFLPFLYPNNLINYNANSAVVAKAAELCAGAENDFDRLKAVFDFVTANITYDNEKAKTVQPGYLPDLDTILASKKGICFDYASMTAAMLRSQGVPTRMVFGYVAPDSVSHAWNEVYIEGKGWITAKIFIESRTWKLMDLTFLAAGVNNSELVAFVGNGSNYTKQEIF